MPSFGNCGGVAVSVSRDGALAKRRILNFITVLLIILVLYEIVFMVLPNMFHSRIAAAEFSEWIRIRVSVCIHYQNYPSKLHAYPWFSSASFVAIAKKNQFICRCGHSGFAVLKQSSDRLIIIRKRLLNLPSLLMLIYANILNKVSQQSYICCPSSN